MGKDDGMEAVMIVVDGVQQHVVCYAIGCKGLQYLSPVCSMCSMLSTAGDVHCQCVCKMQALRLVFNYGNAQ